MCLGLQFIVDFNPRSREGSDQKTFTRAVAVQEFQSTLPRRERREERDLVKRYVISIHAPAKGATIMRGGVSVKYVHFNPRSREGSDGTDSGISGS